MWVGDGPKNLSGSRLVDVLKAVGCVNGPIATLALDGFGSEMSAAKVAAHDWVLSTMHDNTALAVTRILGDGELRQHPGARVSASWCPFGVRFGRPGKGTVKPQQRRCRRNAPTRCA